MEEWDKLIENYPINKDNNLRVALRSAKIVLDKDLAPFESDWIFSTLLQSPVNLLEVVADKRSDDNFTKCVTDALKLLADAVVKYDNIEKYYEDIVQLCLLPYSATQRPYALACLTQVARRAACGARDYNRHVAALQHGACLTPLAVLIGTICECQPNIVAQDVSNIWRVFLNMLDSNKYSSAVTKAVLQGLLGLFKNFGEDLPSAELIECYDKIVGHLEGSCQGVCIEILTHHAGLFFTCVARDARTRKLLWSLRAADALKAVYEVCDKEVAQEVQAYTESSDVRQRVTAHRILGTGIQGEIQEMEHQMRTGGGDMELWDGISWCIPTHSPSSHRLLQATVLLYDTIPNNKRADIIQALLNSHIDVINASVTFMISEVTRDQKLTIWEDILKSNGEKLNVVYGVINKYINTVVEGIVEEMEGPPLCSLLPLLRSLPPRPLTVRRVPDTRCDTAALLAVFSGRLQNGSINKCTDEVKLKCSLVVLEMMEEHTYPASEILAALRTIFSNNVEAAILSKAVNALDVFVGNHSMDDGVLTEIIHNLAKISRQTDRNEKDDRILYRDIFMFLGKHDRPETNNDELNFVISELQTTLTVQIPYEGGSFKLNLNRMLFNALLLEDGEALSLLLTVICANLSPRAVYLQRVLVRVCVCLSHHPPYSSRVISSLAAMDGCTDELIQYIMKEESSESRRVLIEGLEMMLSRRTDGEELERVVDKIIYTGGENVQLIQLLDKIIVLLNDKNSVCLKLLPDLVLRVLRIPETEVLETLYRLFIDKMYLYGDVALHTFIDNIFIAIGNESMDKIDKTVYFIKDVLNKMNKNISEFTFVSPRVLASLKGCFVFDDTLEETVMEVGRSLFKECSDLGVAFQFLSTFFDLLLSYEYDETMDFLLRILDEITSKEIVRNGKYFILCIRAAKDRLLGVPRDVTMKLENYIKNHTKEIENIDKEGFDDDVVVIIRSVRMVVEACDGPILSESDEFIVAWKDSFNRLYDSGYIEMLLDRKFDVLSDLLFVALKYMDGNEIQSFLLRDDFGTNFAASLISVFYPYLNTSLLLNCSILLYDVVRYANRTGRRREVEELIEEIWPRYERTASFRQKQMFLLECLPGVSERSRVYQWVKEVMSSHGSDDEKMMILDVLPQGDIYGSLPLRLLPPLPPRVSELGGARADSFRAVLAALATNVHADVLDAVAKLAANDPTVGWWDWAMESCMRTVARRDDPELMKLVYETCTDCGYGAFARLMLPLLRHSDPRTLVSFVSPLLPGMLSSLRRLPRAPDDRVLRNCLTEHARAFNVLEVVFQKVPTEYIKSPRSELYSALSVDKLYYLVSTVCKLCVTLRTQYTKAGVENEYRLFQNANYACLCSALLCREPRVSFYSCVFDVDVWSELVTDEEVSLPLKPQWVRRVTRHAAPAPSPPSVASCRRSDALRSRVFLRTLSENPLMYDLAQNDEEPNSPELYLPDNPLNRHPCMPHMMAILAKLGAETGEGWLEAVVRALGGQRHVARMIAQAVCNVRDQLPPHAGSLAPPLLALTTHGHIDQLQMDIWDTIIYWKCEINPSDLSRAVEGLVAGIIERRKDSVHSMLMNKLVQLLDIYGNVVNISWSCFEEHFKDPNSTKFTICMKILNRVNIYVPELLPALSPLLARRVTLVWSVFGRMLRRAKDRAQPVHRELDRYRSLLEHLRRTDAAAFIKALYYVQKEFPDVCDLQQFRSVSDLIPKIPHRERAHCLSILTTYIESGGRGDLSVLETIGLHEMIDTAQGMELATVSLPHLSPPSRQRVLSAAEAAGDGAYRLMMKDFELSRSPPEPPAKRPGRLVLPSPATMAGVSRGLAKGESSLPGLSQDLGIRLCECLTLSLVVPLTHGITVRLSSILELFLEDIKQQDVFRNAKLVDVRSNTSAGNQLKTDLNSEEIEISLEDALKTILQFAQRDEQSCTSLIVQLVHQLGSVRPGFDFHSTVGAGVLSSIRTSPAAGLVEIARQVDWWQDVELGALAELVNCTRSSEGEGICRLLYEEILLKRGNQSFVLGTNNICDQEMSAVNEKFTIEDLMSTFGKLSNWESLALQQQTLTATALPPLWTDRHTFELCINNYDFTDAPLWTRCLVSMYKKENMHTYKMMKDLDKWPRKRFDIAAVLESQQWDARNVKQTSINTDCLAKWAFRIMMGTLSTGSYLPSRSHVVWSTRANEMGIHHQVIRCCDNVIANDDKLVSLRHQEMLALRGIALQKNDRDGLRILLDRADSILQLEKVDSFEDMLGLNELTLRLRGDLKCLEKNHLDNIISYMTNLKDTPNFNRKSLDTICVLGLTHLQTLCVKSRDPSEQSQLLASLCALLGLQSSPSPDILLLILDSLRGKLEEQHSHSIMETLRPMMETLDEYSIDQLVSNSHLFHPHPALQELHQKRLSLDRLKRCLCIVADPVYLLKQYIGMLLTAVDKNDIIKYKEVFIRMKARVFDNPHIGPDYIVLNKYRSGLDGVDGFGADAETTKKILKTMQNELRSNKDCLSLSDLCPTLLRERESDGLNKLLGLKDGIRFVKFLDKVSVYIDAVSRPVLLSYVSSDGRTRRCIVKSEGPAHGASVRLRGALEAAWKIKGGYKVCSLSSECVLIEYLEHHTRLRDMVQSVSGLDGPSVSVGDADLILSPSNALAQFEARCRSVPATSLRSAIEARCVTLQEFMRMRSSFTESLCAMTLFSFICGLSDRHLHNILFDCVLGSVCNVDCGEMRPAELPPARVTRTLLAVCHTQVLEARLQKLLSTLREHRAVIIPTVRIAFKNTDHEDKVPFILAKLEGRLLQHQITREHILKSNIQYADSYVRLIDDIFGDGVKSSYTVEEQISNLLLQCTDPRILSVTRSGWEPWI